MILQQYLWLARCAAVSLVVELVVCEPLRLEIFRPTVGNDFSLYHKLPVDNQEQTVIVDTQSKVSIFVWKTWYEELVGKRCESLYAGCYDRQLPYPKESDIETCIFNDGYSVGIFPSSGDVGFGTFLSASTTFGLICRQPPYSVPPRALFGLSPGPSLDRFPSFVEQLMVNPSKPLSGNIFALYLKPDNSDVPTQYKGYLLLGRGDPSVYEAPLRYIPVIDAKRLGWQVRIGFFAFENDERTNVADGRAEIDSGTNTVTIPQWYKRTIMSAIRKKASEAAEAIVDIIPYGPGSYAFNCAYLKFMPILYFGLGTADDEVRIEIRHEGYFLGKDQLLCLLGVTFVDFNCWIIPDTALVGNYFEFDEDGERIGYAKLRAGAT
ncbi:hypothetical protein FOL47_007176 [Perkinsus chesapeaki]|uniref:Peptidase A1 domain-containing protein n=1 Tax=Perkinsus chesapeaki TaxID=330153 RepID=A0A7J6LMH1_PERCH|nr:hypothetical protein FOL47_007176 [Perkinsus chesapeaki]